MKTDRIRMLIDGEKRSGPVVYWMSRDQRLQDNWALIHARQEALARHVDLVIVFCLVEQFLGAMRRQYEFMLRGLEDMAGRCAATGIVFHLVAGDPADKIPAFLNAHKAALLITDFDPLRIKRNWKRAVSERITIPFYEVDAHNIVPCWSASAKQEFSARTLRIKYGRILNDYLDEFPEQERFPSRNKQIRTTFDRSVLSHVIASKTGPQAVLHIDSGEAAAHERLRSFLKERLLHYHRDKNDPTRGGQSGLSVYLHFGQISAQRVALAVREAQAPEAAKAAFLEELIIRRELSDNFCYYNQDYDSFKAFPGWAQATLNDHRRDVRTRLYTSGQFESAGTHDELWNAAQMEMVKTGNMHGYMRMYWAKKILEWSDSPEEALRIAVFLNDKYQLDGRDPNGYTGCAWAIGGLHDRPWQQRPVFGKIRYMNENGCRRKFDVDAYINKISRL